MSIRTPLAGLIEARLQGLELSRGVLGQRLGYQKPAKATGRVYALCDACPLSGKSRRALQRLPAALELPADTVEQAITATEQLFAVWAQETEEQCRLAEEADDAAWRASFRPHAVIQTEHSVPSQITICGLTGGAGRWLVIPIDDDQSPITFVGQAVAGLHERYRVPPDGHLSIPFFGKALGLIVNFAPTSALRCDLDGNPLELLGKAYRPGEVRLSFGGRPLSPSTVARTLGFQ